MMKKLAAVAGMALLLTGCSAATPDPTPTPTVSVTAETTASQEQVASVIAAHESDFRDGDETSFDCRFAYVDDAASIESNICATKQKTIVLVAQNTARDLRALTIPDPMQALVDETLAKLDLIGGVDMVACGDEPDPGDAACSEQLTFLNVYLGSFSDTLDAWGPYL